MILQLRRTFIMICLILTGCSSNGHEQQNPGEESAHVNLLKKHLGFWLYDEYIHALQQTRSTKKASEMGVDDFYNIYNTNSIMRLNIHEGGAENVVVMTSADKGQIFSVDTSEAYSHIEFRDDALWVDNKKYIKASEGLDQLVNGAFVAGLYDLNGQTIEVHTNGEITGLDSISSYELLLDYNDAGAEFDRIYLQSKNNERAQPFIYSFHSDTFIIYQMHCLRRDENLSGRCVETSVGPVVYRLIRKKE